MVRVDSVRWTWCALFAVALTLGLAACGGGAGGADPDPLPAGTPATWGDTGGGSGGAQPTPPPQGDDGTLVGGFLLLLEQEGEAFAVRITNPPAVEAWAAIMAGTRELESISGPILRNGPGAPAYYDPWSWHIDPARVSVNQLPDPALRFDGTPSRVEANLAALVALGAHKALMGPGATIRVIYDLRNTGGPGPIGPPEVPLPR